MSINNQASESCFYTVQTDKLENIETAFSKIESIANDIIRKLDENPESALSKEEKFSLYEFSILQLWRIVAPVEQIRKLSNITVQSLLKAHI